MSQITNVNTKLNPISSSAQPTYNTDMGMSNYQADQINSLIGGIFSKVAAPTLTNVQIPPSTGGPTPIIPKTITDLYDLGKAIISQDLKNIDNVIKGINNRDPNALNDINDLLTKMNDVVKIARSFAGQSKFLDDFCKTFDALTETGKSYKQYLDLDWTSPIAKIKCGNELKGHMNDLDKSWKDLKNSII